MYAGQVSSWSAQGLLGDSLGELTRAARHRASLSQAELAARLGTSGLVEKASRSDD